MNLLLCVLRSSLENPRTCKVAYYYHRSCEDGSGWISPDFAKTASKKYPEKELQAFNLVSQKLRIVSYLDMDHRVLWIQCLIYRITVKVQLLSLIQPWTCHRVAWNLFRTNMARASGSL